MTATIWFAVIMFGLVFYVGLDGYDLGIGMLAITQRGDDDRRSLLELVARVWDGNESWILLIALGLWGGFPGALGLLPALYIPLIVMLFCFIARGVSIEMISNSTGWPRAWGRLFIAGSAGAAFVQGVAIGAVIHGIHLGAGGRFEGGSFDFLSGYSILTGFTTMALYAVSGAAMVKMRSDNARLAARLQRLGRTLIVVLAVLVVGCVVLLPVAGASTLTLGQPARVVVIVWAGLGATVAFLVAWWSLGRSDHPNMAFVAVYGAVAAGLAGILALAYPLIVPPGVTIAEAASPPSSLEFMLAGFGMFVPLTAAYNLYAFWVLRPGPVSGPVSAPVLAPAPAAVAMTPWPGNRAGQRQSEHRQAENSTGRNTEQ